MRAETYAPIGTFAQERLPNCQRCPAGRRDFQQQPQLEGIHDVGRPGDHDPEAAVAFELDHVSLDEPHERLAHWALCETPSMAA